MPPTRAEFEKYMSRQYGYTPVADVSNGYLKTAAVSFEHLTNHEHWDRFLSHIQEYLNQIKQERDGLLSYCGGAVGDALVQSQLRYQDLKGQVKALEFVMGLPVQIMQSYQATKQSEAHIPPSTNEASST